MNKSLILTISLVMPMTTGCGLSLFADRETDPVIQDYASPFFRNTAEIFATKASHRMFIVQKGKHGDHGLVTCAEPSPDVAEAFTSAIASAIKASGSDPNSGINGEIVGQHASAIATQVAPLLYRSQGLQLYRDGLTSLCIDHMNAWIDDATYTQKKDELLKQAAILIDGEKEVMLEAQKAFFENVKAGEAKINISDVTRISDALKSSNTTTTTSTNNATTTTTVSDSKTSAKTDNINQAKNSSAESN